jgi:hypothetical protein
MTPGQPRGSFLATDQDAFTALQVLAPTSPQVTESPTNIAYKAINPDTGQLAEYRELLQCSTGHKWLEAGCREFGNLAHGCDAVNISEGTDTIIFIPHTAVPADRKATYFQMVAADRPNKEFPERARGVVGGDKIDYPGETRTKTSGLTEAKIIFNKVISTPLARFMTIDLKNFYLNHPMARYEYIRIPVQMIPKAIMDQYNLWPLIHNGHVYAEVRNTMYGLPQAGRLANDALVAQLALHGYIQTEHTPGLFTHLTRPICFSLVVDDFGVCYVGKEHAEHLQSILQENYETSSDWTGSQFCGITLQWDYVNRTVDLSMPGYVARALQRFQHKTPTRPEHAPYEWTKPQYGAKIQLTKEEDTSPPVGPDSIKLLQEVIGVLLYYARAIDNTLLVALGSLAAAQTESTTATMKAMTKVLNYAASHPDATIRYKASDMILHIHSDASYLSEPKARSRCGGFFFLSTADDPNPDAPAPFINGPIHITSNIMRNVMASATEAEVGAIFHNAQDGEMLRTTLEELGHPQPATPIQTDNAVAEGIINDKVKQRRSKAIDMRFYWVRDRVRQGHFRIHWKKGSDNLADYFTKHHAPAHHREMRKVYVRDQHPTAKLAMHGEGVLKSGLLSGSQSSTGATLQPIAPSPTSTGPARVPKSLHCCSARVPFPRFSPATRACSNISCTLPCPLTHNTRLKRKCVTWDT